MGTKCPRHYHDLDGIIRLQLCFVVFDGPVQRKLMADDLFSVHLARAFGQKENEGALILSQSIDICYEPPHLLERCSVKFINC
jgi:hypothetical protein